MSRLDGFIRRMIAQRDCINLAYQNLKNIEGPILELGFGNGRTYDHICETFISSDVYVLDRVFKSNLDIIRDSEKMIHGEIELKIPLLLNEFGTNKFKLINSDIGGQTYDYPEADIEIRNFLSVYLPQLLHSKGIIISNLELNSPVLLKTKNPDGVREGKIFMYKLSS